ncbi:alpha/beta hydrolase [Sphingomonas parapaucimobilis]|uniref:alpha/beta hydrolase n=1 Tax=Sphingomonas parapaucimobilis TaxID=28213 RepID=UPI003219FC5D
MVFFYGGSWNSGTRAGYEFVGRALAAQGFVTVIPDYRLVPVLRYPAFVEDGAAAVRWVSANAGNYCGGGQSVADGPFGGRVYRRDAGGRPTLAGRDAIGGARVRRACRTL